ncbi:MAG: TIGR02757 family protein [Marinifilaceae bacterium]
MVQNEIKELLDEKYKEYCRSDFFIETDPIQIPKQFEQKEDIEIAGFLAASLAWGQRPVIIKKCKELMQRMDYTPYDFIMNATESDLKVLEGFKHRTFNSDDAIYFIQALIIIYREYNGLEEIFTRGYIHENNIAEALRYWHRFFTMQSGNTHAHRHIANIDKGSAAKRINMFLRWMVRKDESGIDFGIWKEIPSSSLLIPLDLHTGNVSRELGILNTKQNNFKAVCELTEYLRLLDPKDPIKYDFALFGLGAFK